MQKSQPSPSLPEPKGLTRAKLTLALAIASWVFTLGFIIGFFMTISEADASEGLFHHILPHMFWITPLLALSSWLMANSTLRRIRDGEIPSSAYRSAEKGKRLGMVGTFALPAFLLTLAIVTAMSSSGRISSPKDAIMFDLDNLFANAYQYRLRPTSIGGGEGTYTGYVPAAALVKNENGFYTARVLHGDTIQFLAKWIKDSTTTISVKVGPDGYDVADSWIYIGVFE